MKKLGNGSWVEARRKCRIRGNYRLWRLKKRDGEEIEVSA